MHLQGCGFGRVEIYGPRVYSSINYKRASCWARSSTGWLSGYGKTLAAGNAGRNNRNGRLRPVGGVPVHVIGTVVLVYN